MNNFCCMTLTMIFIIIFFITLRKYYKKYQERKQKIKIIGLGGGGSNIVEYLSNTHPMEYDALIINSDKKALETKNVDKKFYYKKIILMVVVQI